HEEILRLERCDADDAVGAEDLVVRRIDDGEVDARGAIQQLAGRPVVRVTELELVARLRLEIAVQHRADAVARASLRAERDPKRPAAAAREQLCGAVMNTVGDVGREELEHRREEYDAYDGGAGRDTERSPAAHADLASAA